jgi:hypothetical protein
VLVLVLVLVLLPVLDLLRTSLMVFLPVVQPHTSSSLPYSRPTRTTETGKELQQRFALKNGIFAPYFE